MMTELNGTLELLEKMSERAKPIIDVFEVHLQSCEFCQSDLCPEGERILDEAAEKMISVLEDEIDEELSKC